jgi:hypothetical protein
MSGKADDATRVAGLANILRGSNKQKETPPSPAPPAATVVETSVQPAAKRSKKERVGKKSDPHFRLCGLYLRRVTEKRARRRLEDTQPEKDFSDLVQELLEQWLTSQ